MKAFEYDKKDVPVFQKEVCPTCVCKGRCIEEGKDTHWFLMCPHYHRWKVGYTSWVADLVEWQNNHKEEVEKEHEKVVERAKKWKAEKKKKK